MLGKDKSLTDHHENGHCLAHTGTYFNGSPDGCYVSAGTNSHFIMTNQRAPTPRMQQPITSRRLALAFGSLVLALATVPRSVCGRNADSVFDGELSTQVALADGVVAATARRTGNVYYRTGTLRFDGQSAVAIDQMAIMGLSQIVQLHPELREKYLKPMRALATNLADPRTLAYASRVYGHHGALFMGKGEGHAYLGYINLGLGMLRAVDPDTPLAALHDRLSAALAERLFQSPTGMIETYPGLSSALAGQDVIAALLRRELGAVLLVALVLGLRLFLMLAAPGWLLWLVVERLERFAASSSSRQRPDT